jgi:hypothetical protein
MAAFQSGAIWALDDPLMIYTYAYWLGLGRSMAIRRRGLPVASSRTRRRERSVR